MKPGQEELTALAASIELLVFDVDGTLTDSGMYYGPQGETLKRFDVKDGFGLVLARMAGLKLAWLSARSSKAVAARAEELRISSLKQGRTDKGPALVELLSELGVAAQRCAYMGDDVNDLDPMGRVGLPACPADAVMEVRQKSLFIARSAGGHGAARELVEVCLKASDKWDGVQLVLQRDEMARNPSAV